jgi:O-antigen/teichoic acid export membrane protein
VKQDRPPGRISLFQALLWFAASYGLAILGYLGANAVASRWLGIHQYGYFVVALTASAVVGQLGLLGAHRGGLREAARMTPGDDEGLMILKRGARAAVLVSLPAASLVSGLVVYVTASGDLWSRLTMAGGFALLVAFGGLQKLWSNYLRGLGRVRFASLLEGRSGGALVSCLQAVTLALAWWLAPWSGLAGAVLALAVGFAIPVLLAGRVVTRHWAHLKKSSPILEDVVDMYLRNWRFAVNQFATYLGASVELWIAGALLIAADASYFSAAQRMALLLSIAPTSLQVVFAPVASRMLDAQDHARLEAVLRTGASLSAAVTSVLLIPMLVAPAKILELAFGDPFRAAAVPLLLLTLANVANVLSGLCGTALTMSHQEGAVAGVQAVGVTLRLVVGCVAALAFGLMGLAVSAMVLTAATYASTWWLARRRLGLRTEPTLRPRLSLLRRTQS